MKISRLLIAILLIVPSLAHSLPNRLIQEGIVLTRDGAPMEGEHDVRIRLYNAVGDDLPFFDERHEDVAFVDGFYAVVVGSINAIDPAVFSRANVFLGVTIDNQPEMQPRTPLLKVPSTFVADVALDVRGSINPSEVFIEGVGRVINANGEWVGSNVGLRGPEGPVGPEGPIGPAGPPGDVIMVDGEAGLEDLPERVLRQLDQAENPPFLRRDANDSTTGTLTFNRGAVAFNRGAGEPYNALQLNNNNIADVNSLQFNDPGEGEGISWKGSTASISVGPAEGGNGDGPLRIQSVRNGIRLEGPTSVLAGLTVTGGTTQVLNLQGQAANLLSMTAENANITTLNGPNDRITVNSSLALNANVILDDTTAFVGTIRTGGLQVNGAANFLGDLTGNNLRAEASIFAAGNVTSGHDGLVRSGSGGIFVGDRQVFDGRGNLLSRPTFSCPQGQVMFGTDGRGVARCIDLNCDGGQVLRGVNGFWEPVCVEDDRGLTRLPAIECPPGMAVLRMDASGRAHCGFPRSGELVCPEGEFVTGIDPNGTVICGVMTDTSEASVFRQEILVCGDMNLNIRRMLVDNQVPIVDQLNQESPDACPDEQICLRRGCTPTDQTQAMIVTRNSADDYDAGLVRSYVRAGGIILTAYGNSHIVFQDVFEVSVDIGEREGACGDNINPPVRLNTRNRFWKDNTTLDELREISGCGHRIDHFPEITPLGGWEEGKVSLGYRDLGLGRVWLIEADWGDESESWTAESGVLASYMMLNGRREGDLFEFDGIRGNIADSRLIGWYMCYSSRYGDQNLSLVDMQQRCNGDKVMLGCRPVGAPNWTLLAMGLRNEVFRNTGDGNNVVNRHNNIDWYFSSNWSMGFAAAGSGVSRNRCDNRGEPARNKRMCWHTEGNQLMGGYRCGARTGLGNSLDWERAVFTNRLSAGQNDIYESCRDVLAAAEEDGEERPPSGIYNIMPPGASEPQRIYCDHSTDDGGWTLVASSRNDVPSDQASSYYEDLASLSPGSSHSGIWDGMRGFGERKFDVRFTCRDRVGGANDPMAVDLSFYDVDWYMEWTTGSDGESCFEEDNGQGATNPSPRRRNNIAAVVLEEGDAYSAGFLEGEDSCNAEDDFTVDFDDRGMGGNPQDGTDWGIADGRLKCGTTFNAQEGQWFVFVRERDAIIPEVDISDFQGILTNYPDNRLYTQNGEATGWCQCHVSRYAQKDILLRDIKRVCNGEYTMLGCRPAGSPNWSVLAMGETAKVFRNTRDNNNITHEHNGVAWYYSVNQSMGFSPLGVPVRRAGCDTDNTQGERKLCWHTETERLAAGWRCGTDRSLNGGLAHERAIWTRGGEFNCTPPENCNVQADCNEGLTCQEGRCLPPPPECLVDRDCDENFACRLGQCEEILPECRVETDCEGEEICFEGNCVNVAPPPVCLADNECAGGNICRDGQCVRPPCGEDDDCRVDLGEVCAEGACLIPCENIGDCPANNNCTEGFCVPAGN